MAGSARRPKLRGLLVAAILASCSDGGAPEPAASPARPETGAARDASLLSPSARPGIHDMLVEDRARTRSPADGAGRAWLEAVELEPGRSRLRAGDRARFVVGFEAGPLGIAEGGSLFLQTSPFWGWDPAQSLAPEAPGYTTVHSEAEGLDLRTETVERGLVRIAVEGRALAAGERLEIRYGDGPGRARVDRFAEREEALHIAVDGDGDGVRRLLPDPPRIDVGPGPARQLRVILPTVARPGEAVDLRLAWLDDRGNRASDIRGPVRLDGAGALGLPEAVSFGADGAGIRVLAGRAEQEGIVRVVARVPQRAGPDAEEKEAVFESNPLLVSAEAPRVLWADLHGHSQLSDGTGTPEDYYAYARDVAGLDVAALTDHDHWGLRSVVDEPALWERIRRAARAHHEPGRFVALRGVEWTSWLYGHRHVLDFSADDSALEEPPSSLDPATETPGGLWSRLSGRPVLTFAHHSAGGPVATAWSEAPPPEIEPVTEITSVHGSSEAPDSPDVIYSAVPGNFVRDVLDRGFRLGFVGSGDGHDGHPGLAHLDAGRGGLAAVFSEERTREGVLGALRARRCYATNGPRIWLRSALEGRPMGARVPAVAEEADTEWRLEVAALAPGPLDRIELVRSGRLLEPLPLSGERFSRVELGIPGLRTGEYLYVRVVQRDGGTAWSSPFFAE